MTFGLVCIVDPRGFDENENICIKRKNWIFDPNLIILADFGSVRFDRYRGLHDVIRGT